MVMMHSLKVAAVGLLAGAALAAGPGLAKPVHAPPRPCCHVIAGTVVEIALAEEVGTKIQRTGDTFAIRLATPLVVDGRLVLRAGTRGVGEVISASKPGMGGKAAKMVLAARYLEGPRGRVPLQGLQLSAAGKDNSMEANAIGLSGIAFGPLGFIGLAVPGGNVDFPEGVNATAEVASDVILASLGPAPRGMTNASLAFDNAAPDLTGMIPLPAPPQGMGQVVFFRAKSVLGTGQWFNVRENGDALGKLSNGAYFVQVATPGIHTYTATMEPEAKDKLRLEIDPGQTYFVQGTLTKGLAIGFADLSPSSRDAFDKASKSLRLATAPAHEGDEDLGKYPDANATDDPK
jgi:hypothetical protein